MIVENEDIVNGLGETPAPSSAPRASRASLRAAARPDISTVAIETISKNSDQIGLKLEICELQAEIKYNTVERAVFDHFIKLFHDSRVSDDEYRMQCVNISYKIQTLILDAPLACPSIFAYYEPLNI